MENNEIQKDETIDLREVFLKLWHHKRLYAIVLIIAFIIGCIYVLPKPRYYDTTVSLAPESTGNDLSSGGSISSIASSFGIDLGGMQSSDAIYPLLYPDLLSSSNFLVSLFDLHVTTIDGKVSTDYYTYLTKHQKRSPWEYPKIWLTRMVNSILPKSDDIATSGNGNTKGNGVNPFRLNKQQTGIVGKLKNDITCNVDRKTNVISITVRDQDPLISATVADSVRVRLQDFITTYRTSKARQDVAYYEKLTRKAKADYERVRQIYGSYADANMDVVLESYKSKTEDLENDMQLKYNQYTAFNTQLQAARANLLRRTPAFTTIQEASVPIKPAGPKRMITIVGFLFLAFIGTTLYILRKGIAHLLMPAKKQS